jgi:protein-tyrosine phosphatase
MYEMRCVLERNDSCVRVIRARRPGYIVYEDEYQVVAEPFADLGL